MRIPLIFLNILGDTELVQALAKALAPRIMVHEPTVLVTAEAKSIPLAYQLAADTGLPYVVLRKSYKPYMGDALEAHTVSITTGTPQRLYLDEKDQALPAPPEGRADRRRSLSAAAARCKACAS